MANIFGLTHDAYYKPVFKPIFNATTLHHNNQFINYALHKEIDDNLKKQFIMPFLEGELTEVVKNFDSYYERTIKNLNKYTINSGVESEYLANLSLLSLGIVNRGYYCYKDNLAALGLIDQLRADLLGKIAGPKIATALKATVEGSVHLDMRYISYIQTHGLPPGGVFDPVKLSKFIG